MSCTMTRTRIAFCSDFDGLKVKLVMLCVIFHLQETSQFIPSIMDSSSLGSSKHLFHRTEYSEDEPDEFIQWNERLDGTKGDPEWTSLLQNKRDVNSESDQNNNNNNNMNKKINHQHQEKNSTETLTQPFNHHEPLENPLEGEYKVYRERWLMLLYMSTLNILSDWTCYSIAPISLLIAEEYPQIDPQSLVTIFLIASSISTLLEPMILARVGLRRTVVLGAFLLLVGNAIKSGLSGAILNKNSQADLSAARTYVGFSLVGLSQPLYQCTPALLSASWFPDDERTLATGLALNSNQLGIGFAFTFGTVLVDSRRAVLPYFTLLSILSALAFVGCLVHFQDAPPTPPSKTARVMKGNFVFKFTNNTDLREYIGDQLSRARNSWIHEFKPGSGGSKYQDSTCLIPNIDGHLHSSTRSFSPGISRRNTKDMYTSLPNPMDDIIKSPNVDLQRHKNDVFESGDYHKNMIHHFYNPDPDHPWFMWDARTRFEDGVEPIIIQSDRYLEIDILDDQLLRSIRACFSRAGFIHTLVAFTVSSVVVNVISTYMDYLMRIGGADSMHVGIIGGLFQIVIVVSGILMGKVTDHTRSYYSTTIALLVLGAFALAECGIDLDRGTDLQWSLLLTAIFVGPLQPIATELGVDVCFPLCENTVLVIQQLFASLISALFIPLFQAVSNVGQQVEGSDDRPQYMFSLYLLIVIHAVGTVYFATFDGRYLRLEHEKESQGA